MPLSNPPQKPLAWYAADPLRGSGKNGTLRDDDFLSALYISRMAYQAIKRSCIRILDKQVENSQSKIDLRTLWKGRNGRRTKATMIEDLIHAHPKAFDDTRRLQHVPANWNTVKHTLAELCMVSANASRSRQLQRRNTDQLDLESSNAHTHDTTLSSPTDIQTACKSQMSQMSLRGLHFLFTHPLILDNITVPVVYEDRSVDILPHRFRRSDAKLGEPQHIRDVALDRLLSILAQEFKTESIPQLWGMNSRGSLFELENDDHLTTALISFLPFAWTGGYQHLPGLEVRVPSGTP
jgi:hypothetical protein